MLDVAIGIVFLFFAFAMIGLGPSLFFFKNDKSLQIIYFLALAPVIGLILTSIFGTYFVLLNYQVSIWAVFWLSASGISSLVIFFTMLARYEFSTDKKTVLIFYIGLISIFFLLLAPMVMGELHFTVLRGNGTDTFNYMTMAGYLLNKPYFWITQASNKELIDAHPSYVLAKELLTERWTTSMILAWCSKIVNIPIYRLEYGFTALFFTFLYCCTFIFSTLLKIPLRYVLLLSIAVCVGFWAQVVLDIRAMSQISALPLVVLVGILLVRIDVNNKDRCIGERVLFGLTIAALFFLYAEIVPTVIFGVFIYWLIGFYHKEYSVEKIKKYFLSILIAFIVFLPLAGHLFNFFLKQIHLATSFKNDWYNAYFHWLYSQPINGFWGLCKLQLPKDWFLLKVILLTLAAGLSIVLFFIFIKTIFKIFFKKSKSPVSHVVCVAFFLAIFFEFVFLFSKGQLWAAAKSLTYGYPFIMMIIVLGVFTKESCVFVELKQHFFKICKIAIALWLVLQCSFGIYRVLVVAYGAIPSYISNHGYYLQHDWNVDSFLKYIKKNKINSFGICIKDPWIYEYFGFVFGYDIHLVNLCRLQDRNGNVINIQEIKKYPSHILLKKGSFCSDGKILEVENTEYELIKYSKNFENCIKQTNNR